MSNDLNYSPEDREIAYKETVSLRTKYGERALKISSANEATTRLLLIDKTLEILGWSKDEFNPEEAISRISYIDYLLKIDGAPRLIVEAKKVSYTFGTPHRKSRKNHYTLAYLRSAFGQAFTEVLAQAERYALQNRVPFAVLTNGCEWLLVQLVLTPGFPEISDIKGIYFGNIFSDDFNFDLFWELLFRNHVEEGSIEAYFAQLNSKEADYSRTPQAQFGNLQWRMPQGNERLQDFYQLFFTQIIDPGRRNMLEKCFVSNSQLDHYQGELQRTLRDSAPPFIENAIELIPEEREKLISSESGDQKGRVVLVTGSVGCGKTTLVHKVLVEARQNRTFDVLIIDLINQTSSSQILTPTQLWKYIKREWKKANPQSYEYEELCKIFGYQLSTLRKGPFTKLFENDEQRYLVEEAKLLEKLTLDPEEYFQYCWRYYQQKNHGVVVFFDNVDRASQENQQQVYAFAHELAYLTGATVILTMREFTFFRGKEAGFLDIRSSDTVFHLKSPNLMQVLSRRIKYIENHLEDDHRLSKWRKREGWETQRGLFLSHADTLKRTFLITKYGQDRLSILEAIAWHNVRYFLQNLKQLHSMLGSGYEPWQTTEIIASLMTPTNKSSNKAVISNIYRPSYPTFQCYYLKLRVLLLQIFGQPEYQTRRGTSLNRLLNFLSLYGYHERWTKRAIEELVQERFLECLEAPAEEDFTKQYEVHQSHSFRPSPLSIVLIERIIEEPIYLCLIGNDLPFHNPNVIENYKASLTEVYDSIGSDFLERAAIDLIPEVNLGKIVATYLVTMYEKEQPPENLLNHVPEIGATENQLHEIIKTLKSFSDFRMPLPKRDDQVTQMALFVSEPSLPRSNLANNMSVPENIAEIRIDRSEQAPLIFWALVALKNCNKDFATGAEITEVINEYLVDDHHKKAPNNISRSLRSDTLQSQPWLITQHVSPRKKHFGLNEGWEIYWLEVFGEPPPKLN